MRAAGHAYQPGEDHWRSGAHINRVVIPRCRCGWESGGQSTGAESRALYRKHLAAMLPAPVLSVGTSTVRP